MTPDTCPHCGAPQIPVPASFIRFSCGTKISGWQPRPDQSPECARYVRTRISQLRRMEAMSHLVEREALSRYSGFSGAHRYYVLLARFGAFQRACLREIDRMRGGA